MCLITFSYKQHPTYNLILVANRDEFFERPTSPLHNWAEHKHIYAGQDLLQGGTWLGVSSRGRFTAVTNYRNGSLPVDEKKSRGQLTLDFLASEQTGSEYLQNLQSRAADYGGFNLLAADASGMYYLSNAGGGYRIIHKGLYGLSNAHLNTDWPKVQAARDALQTQVGETRLDPERLSTILHDQTQVRDELLPDTGVTIDWERVLSSSFIQTPEYGTRCTTVILQTYSGETHILEQNFGPAGKTGVKRFDLQLPAFGTS